jgi:hypothetical protein
MTKRGNHEKGPLRGKVACCVFAASLLLAPGCSVPGFARLSSQAGQYAPQPGYPPANRPRPQGQPHLGEWLVRHQNLSLPDQERALQNEPGFNQLPPETQQRLMGRLQQLNRMPPARRQRTIDQIEAMERLSPEMRQQVRGSFQQFRAEPMDRQRMMKKAFRDLREYPPEQRQAMMNSSQFQAQFSPQERSILGNMLEVEPYRPGAGPLPSEAPQYGH